MTGSQPGAEGVACSVMARGCLVSRPRPVVVSLRVIASLRSVVVQVQDVADGPERQLRACRPGAAVPHFAPVMGGSVPDTAAARWRGAGWHCVAGRRCFVPQSAERVDAVALVLPGSRVADEGVERVPVEGELH